MTEETDNKSASKTIDFIAHCVSMRGDKRYFTPIGVCFRHKKGDGITLKLNAHPIGDEIVLFPPSDSPE